MKTVSNLFKDYVFANSREFETKATIAGVVYDNTSLIDFVIENSLIPADDFTMGTVISSKLIIRLKTSNVVPTNASIAPEVRLKGAGYTEWLALGKFYIDSRSYRDGVWEFTCYDKLIITNQAFVSTLSYPALMSDVMTELAGQLELQLDSSVVINPAYDIPYKDEDITIHDMLAYIAMCHCSSVKLTSDEKISFVKFSPDTLAVAGLDANQYFTLEKTNAQKTYTKIVVTYNADGETLSSGSGDAVNTLELYNPFMTQDILDDMLNQFNGYSFTPYNLDWKSALYIEVGDKVQIIERNGSSFVSPILTDKISIKGGSRAFSAAPSYAEQKSEFKYTGGLFNKINQLGNVVQQDVPYYGVVIGKLNGLKIVKSVGSSQVILNSDKQAFQALEGGVMVDKLYFDPILGEYKFVGRLYTEHAIVGIGSSIGSMNIELDDSTYISFRAATIVTEGTTKRTMMIGKVSTPGELPTKMDRIDILAGTLYVYDNLFVQGNIDTTNLGGLPLVDFLNSPHVRFVENLDYTSMNWYDHPIIQVHDESSNVEAQPVANWNFNYGNVANVVKHLTQAEINAKTDWMPNQLVENIDEELPLITELASTATLEDVVTKVNSIISALDGWMLRRS